VVKFIFKKIMLTKAKAYEVNERNSWMSNPVYLPGSPSPIILLSNFTTGTISLVVTAMKSSSAQPVCCGVNGFSITFNPIFLPACIANLRVIEGRILPAREAVCSVRQKKKKNAELAPSVIRPASSTSIASAQPFLAASWLARTLANRFNDFMSHLFHRQSG